MVAKRIEMVGGRLIEARCHWISTLFFFAEAVFKLVQPVASQSASLRVIQSAIKQARVWPVIITKLERAEIKSSNSFPQIKQEIENSFSTHLVAFSLSSSPV